MPSKPSKTMRRIHSRFNHLDQLARNLERVAQKPHNGCQKFSARFGVDAVRWVNGDMSQRRRGLEASCTLHTIKAYCRNREKLWKAATK